MFGYKNSFKSFDDGALEREEQELRQLLSSLGAEQPEGPSDAYWQMLPQRVMARIRREESKQQRAVWTAWWKPAVSLTAMVTAVIAFVMFHAAPVTLDQVTASLSDNDVQAVEQSQTGVAPVSSDEQTIAADIASQVGAQASANDSDSDDLDAILTIGNADSVQVADEPQMNMPLADQAEIENLSDQETNAVIQSLKTEL